jgi:Sugar-specific transcriptional regulator TrmB
MNLNTTLQKTLLDAGLSEMEVLVYGELSKNPADSVWELVTRTGLSKSSVYRAVEQLVHRKLVSRDENGIRALSLKALVSDLSGKERKLRKTALTLRQMTPLLKMGNDTLERFETLYTRDQIEEAFMFMAEHDYGVCLDFGDCESLFPHVGGVQAGQTFRNERVKHAKSEVILTTWGDYSEHFSRKADKDRFQFEINYLNVDFKEKFMILNDKSDYVFFSCVEDEEMYAYLIKSKAIADIQRAQFKVFSQQLGNR